MANDVVILEINGDSLEVNVKYFPLKIEFNGKEYTLRITKNEKLILN